MARATLKLRIAQPGGEESLNVAAAAAICLHASVTAAPSGL
jgi:TrmH family RNA methyltransferase